LPPTVLREKSSEYFEIDAESPYMQLVANVRPEKRVKPQEDDSKLFGFAKLNTVRSEIPAVTHVDYSARLQTIQKDDHALYYDMISRFNEKHHCPVVINTSFNVRGEPIVCTPEHAYTCFMRTNMDYLVMGNYLLEKKEQKPLDKDIDWLREFELD